MSHPTGQDSCRQPAILIVAEQLGLAGCETVTVSQEDIDLVRSGQKVLLEAGYSTQILSFMHDMPDVNIVAVDDIEVKRNLFKLQQVPVYPGERKVKVLCSINDNITMSQVDDNEVKTPEQRAIEMDARIEREMNRTHEKVLNIDAKSCLLYTSDAADE